MTSILKVDTLQDSGGNAILSSDGAGTITTSAGLNTAITNAGFVTSAGITEADQWRLTTSFSLSGGVTTDITTNLERVDTAGQGYIGTGMTQSSGIFTFPSTGIYLVNFYALAEQIGDNRYIQAYIKVTTNNSSYSTVAYGGQFSQTSSSSDSLSFRAAQSFIDVTDTANVKVKFSMLSASSTPNIIGSSSLNATCMTFIRLGDT